MKRWLGDCICVHGTVPGPDGTSENIRQRIMGKFRIIFDPFFDLRQHADGSLVPIHSDGLARMNDLGGQGNVDHCG